MCEPDLKQQKELAKIMEPVTEERRVQQAAQVEHLLKIPLPEQRTEGWYKMRENFITASDWGKVLGLAKSNSVKSIILSKCGVKSYFPAKSGPLAWGIRFEEVATQLYEKRRNVKIIEFGCIPHPKIDFLGASPDGITKDGVMLEIKCPYSRKINGTVPAHYWAQVQGQLEVCELDICDYLECEIVKYDSFQSYLADSDNDERGVLVTFEDKEGNYTYRYSKFAISKEEYETWLEELIVDEIGKGHKYIRSEFWWCRTFSVVRIYRDQEWFKRALQVLERFWKEEVLPCKKNGYDHLLTKPKDVKGNISIIPKDDILQLFAGKPKSAAVMMYADPKLMSGRYLFKRDGSQFIITDELIGYHDHDYEKAQEKQAKRFAKPKTKKKEGSYLFSRSKAQPTPINLPDKISPPSTPTKKGKYLFSRSRAQFKTGIEQTSVIGLSKPKLPTRKGKYMFSRSTKVISNVSITSETSTKVIKKKGKYMFSKFKL